MPKLILAALALLATLSLAAADAAHKHDYKRMQTLITKGDKTVIGQTVRYPGGPPAQITSLIVTLKPGESTGWHEHAVPSYGYILEGEVQIDYGPKGKRTFKAGDAFLEVIDYRHNTTCTSEKPARILAVFMGAKGYKNVVRDKTE